MNIRCACACHLTPDEEHFALERGYGVDAADPLEAAVACPSCLNNHCVALLVEGDIQQRPVVQPIHKTHKFKPHTPWVPPDDDVY